MEIPVILSDFGKIMSLWTGFVDLDFIQQLQSGIKYDYKLFVFFSGTSRSVSSLSLARRENDIEGISLLGYDL